MASTPTRAQWCQKSGGGDGHQPVMEETHKTIRLKDELSSDTACAHKTSNIKI